MAQEQVLSGPKHKQIFEEMHRRIRTGKFKPGQQIPTDAELVKEFGASRPTVARALQELERRGLVSRRPGSGTYVQHTEQSGMLFGFIIPGLSGTEIFEPICAEIAAAAQDDNHTLLWATGSITDDPDTDPTKQVMRICRQFSSKNVSGVFFAPFVVAQNAEMLNTHILDQLDNAGITTVLLDRDIAPYPKRSNHDLIGIDNRRAGYIVTEHLLEQGCKKLLFLAHPYQASTIEARIDGYEHALRLRNISSKTNTSIYCDPTDANLVANLLKKHKPDGIVCGNDVTAGQLMHSLDNLNISVPKDILVAGMDDVKYAELLRTPLTTVHQPCKAIGRAAYLAMIERMEWPEAPARDILLSINLITRDSSIRA
ncbi:GntR family transcriptional regulator [Poriferisphaera sp. WC338]|uniref:GntR family transcriptional regulator n=1 Tax=Poriferisphaera sp. WC338 TaxID=3425129 RepID=UPI003D812C27